jgi:MFS family permease
MNQSENTLRITALWAFSEALLGGILHALQIPFAGLVLSAFAVICMAALAVSDYHRGKILKATLLVIIVKALLSPHTPVAAYFAVFLQGLFGELIFMMGISYFIACLSLGIFALLQSAFQKLIILTIIFGVDFWKAMDEFLNGITKLFGIENVSYSFYAAVIFILLHFVAGIFTGIFAGRLPLTLKNSEKEFADLKFELPDAFEETQPRRRKKKKFTSPLFWFLFLFLAFGLYQAYSENSMIAFIESKALKLLIRAVLIIIFWYFFLAPLLLKIFHKWLSKQRNKFSAEIEKIIQLLPEMKYMTVQCWYKTSDRKGFKRLNRFIRFTFFMLLKDSK